MSIEKAREALNSLNPEYRALIHWQRVGLNDVSIGHKLSISKDLVYQRRKQIEVGFNMVGVDYPSADVYAALERYFSGPPKFDALEEEPEPTPLPDPQPAPEEIVEPAPTYEEHSQDGVTIIDPAPDPPVEPQVRERGCFNLPVIMGAVILVLAVLLFLSVLRSLGLQERIEGFVPDVVERQVEVTRIIQEVITAPPDPAVIADFVASTVEAIPTLPPEVVTVAPQVIQETVVVTALATVEVPVEVTREVQVLVDPEGNIIQTQTPIPEDQRVFVESFADGAIEEPFVIVSGKPVFINGFLTTREGETIVLQIGDETWTDYEIFIRGWVWTTGVGTRRNHFFVNIRATDSNNSYELASDGYTNRWYMARDGNRERVPGDVGGVTYYWPQDGSSYLRIIVEGNKIQSYYNDKLQTTFFDDTYTSGGIFIRTGDNSANLHEIRVTRLD